MPEQLVNENLQSSQEPLYQRVKENVVGILKRYASPDVSPERKNNQINELRSIAKKYPETVKEHPEAVKIINDSF